MAQNLFDEFLTRDHDLAGADESFITPDLKGAEIVSIQVSSDKDFLPDGAGTTQVKIFVINTESIITINPIPTSGGSGYKIGDILSITGGKGGKVEVTGVTGGVVDTVSLIEGGIDYTVGAGKVTSGGSGTGCTIEIINVADFVERTDFLIIVTKKNDTHIRTFSNFDGRRVRCDIKKLNATGGKLAIHLLGKIKGKLDFRKL